MPSLGEAVLCFLSRWARNTDFGIIITQEEEATPIFTLRAWVVPPCHAKKRKFAQLRISKAPIENLKLKSLSFFICSRIPWQVIQNRHVFSALSYLHEGAGPMTDLTAATSSLERAFSPRSRSSSRPSFSRRRLTFSFRFDLRTLISVSSLIWSERKMRKKGNVKLFPKGFWSGISLGKNGKSRAS